MRQTWTIAPSLAAAAKHLQKERRFHAARPITLHPPVLGKGEGRRACSPKYSPYRFFETHHGPARPDQCALCRSTALRISRSTIDRIAPQSFASFQSCAAVRLPAFVERADDGGREKRRLSCVVAAGLRPKRESAVSIRPETAFAFTKERGGCRVMGRAA